MRFHTAKTPVTVVPSQSRWVYRTGFAPLTVVLDNLREGRVLIAHDGCPGTTHVCREYFFDGTYRRIS